MENENRMIGALVGLAAGDAVGTTVEFSKRGSFEPLTDMVGHGPFQLKKGQWTDDTSMALCLGHSLIEQNGFDAHDQMQRYVRWRFEGYMSSTGTCFDIGNTVAQALHNFRTTGEAFAGSTEPRSAGNGSIMRLAPIPIYYHRDLAALIHYAGESSKTTHGTAMCVDSCMLFAQLIHRAFSANSKQEIFENLPTVYSKKLDPIIDLSFTKERYDDIKGSGFVIESIIAALWCFWHANDFREAILLAANLGDDADTTAAVCGQIAGAYWGYDSIPQDWREALTMEDEIKNLAIKLIHNAG